jgi:hypothetical protein
MVCGGGQIRQAGGGGCWGKRPRSKPASRGPILGSKEGVLTGDRLPMAAVVRRASLTVIAWAGG